MTSKFIPFSAIAFTDLTSENGIYQFDNVSENPNPTLKFLVRCGCGFIAFEKKLAAKAWLKKD
jgi:hypothetical protein